MTMQTFDVSGSKLYEGEILHKDPMLLIRFAPNPELNNGQPYATEWQVEVEGDITPFLDLTGEVRGEHSIVWGGPINTSTLNRDVAALARLLTPNCPVGIMTENLIAYATPLMRDLMEQFKAAGREVTAVGKYSGSFGASHFLRSGVFYKRPADQ